jgi:DNA-binding PadR family transcriptional regulator
MREADCVAKRGAALELAVLGLLAESPMHGYELRKQVNTLLGWGRVLSYGTLYPCLKALLRQGNLTENLAEPVTAGPLGPPRARRGRIVYRLSPSGHESLAQRMREAGPSAWEDDTFGIYFAFFSGTDAATRLRILEGRRSRLEERLHAARHTGPRTRLRTDAYARELYRHGLEGVERELAWLTSLIEAERSGTTPPDFQAAAPNAPGSEP